MRIRIITEKLEGNQSIEMVTRDLTKNPLLTIKYISTSTPVCIMIFDSKEVHLRIAKGAVPSFWSNNPNIVNLSKKYFEEMWNKI